MTKTNKTWEITMIDGEKFQITDDEMDKLINTEMDGFTLIRLEPVEGNDLFINIDNLVTIIKTTQWKTI